eukprot:s324_g14.t1
MWETAKLGALLRMERCLGIREDSKPLHDTLVAGFNWFQLFIRVSERHTKSRLNLDLQWGHHGHRMKLFHGEGPSGDAIFHALLEACRSSADPVIFELWIHRLQYYLYRLAPAILPLSNHRNILFRSHVESTTMSSQRMKWIEVV